YIRASSITCQTNSPSNHASTSKHPPTHSQQVAATRPAHQSHHRDLSTQTLYVELTQAYELTHSKYTTYKKHLTPAIQYRDMLLKLRDEKYLEYTSEEYMQLLADLDKSMEKV